MKNSSLYRNVISSVNIYNAIYSLESYTFEKELLSKDDIHLFNKLTDKYDKSFLDEIIQECQEIITAILNSQDYFQIKVFFKPKKYDLDNREVDFRPIHTADLKTQICIVALLNQFMFDDTGAQRKLSDISRLLPSNFYGNIPSTNVLNIFKPWGKQYQEYSQKAIDAQKQYVSSGKYKHEINLDIKKFYPSIDPMFIYDFIISKWPINYSQSDLKCLNIILEKLLFFKLEISNDCLALYYPEKTIEEIKKRQLYYNVGLPQGLPQAYFFGNICMSLISREIEKEFEGDAYYYVDDSVIFSNSEIGSFHKTIGVLNEQINKQIKGTITTAINDEKIKQLQELLNYTITIHNDPLGKSSISEISKNFPLYTFARPTSTLSFEILASIDEFEDSSLQKKTEAILSLIEYRLNELDFKKENGSRDENTLKLLKRYKKFYTNRLNILKLREDNDRSEEDISNFIKHYGLSALIHKTRFFDKLEDDVFIVESKLLIKQLQAKKSLQNKLIKAIQTFENKINSSKGIKHYFSTVLNNYVVYLNLADEKYKTLEADARKSILSFEKVKKEKKIDFIKLLILALNAPDICPEQSVLLKKSFGFLLTRYAKGYFKFVAGNVPDFTRKIVNAIISKAFSVSLNDSSNFIKQDNRSIHYYELRILMLARSRSFNVPFFTQLTGEIVQELEQNQNNGKIDLSLFEVLPIFVLYVRDPEKIDNLILVHKYVNGIWKNGSKFLHFYTLHNEEHSIELINNSVKITKAIDYLSIKKEDFYLLFLSCYLHDIAMVLYPRLDEFTENNHQSDLIYSSWKTAIAKIGNIEQAPKGDIKAIMLEYYSKINDYFENKIRSNHHKEGATFIKKQTDLGFLEPANRKLVADISEAHCYDTKDVYKIKSKAYHDICDEKYLMIILRLADLLDMSKDRVSINILRQNINNMSATSKYHWISHLAIDNCMIDADFPLFDPDLAQETNNFRLKEVIRISITMNTKLLVATKKRKCKDLHCQVNLTKSETPMKIRILRGQNCQTRCNFTCRWITNKHAYLFNELIELQRYLDRNTNNIFDTEIEVNFNFDNSSYFPPDYLDIIKKEIE